MADGRHPAAQPPRGAEPRPRTDSEKLDWFEVINIAGERLTNQELRNAVYAGRWVTDAKRYFSRTGCVASKFASRYVSGRPIRQDYLETAIRWASRNSIEDYMGRHQHDPDAESLWEHFKAIIRWAQATFTVYRPAMKTVDWGPLYNAYRDAEKTLMPSSRRRSDL